METIQLIVTALVAGATTALEGTAGQAVRDAYQGLKTIIRDRYSTIHCDVEQLESQPANQELRKQIIELGLQSADAGKDMALQQQAQALLNALQEEFKRQPHKATGVSLAEIEAAAVNLKEIMAQGESTVTGVAIKGAKVVGEINISDVQATNAPTTAHSSSQSSDSSQSFQIKILFLAANPSDRAHLRIDEEIRGIDQALRLSDMRDKFKLILHGAVRINDLQTLIMRHMPHIVHFSGHGEANEIILQDANGESAPVSGMALAGLFAIFKAQIHCVVLNACYSESQANAIHEQIDCVIGMSDTILDESARHFSHAFYQALGYGQSMQNAFELGCNQLDLHALNESHKPRLLI